MTDNERLFGPMRQRDLAAWWEKTWAKRSELLATERQRLALEMKSALCEFVRHLEPQVRA